MSIPIWLIVLGGILALLGLGVVGAAVWFFFILGNPFLPKNRERLPWKKKG